MKADELVAACAHAGHREHKAKTLRREAGAFFVRILTMTYFGSDVTSAKRRG